MSLHALCLLGAVDGAGAAGEKAGAIVLALLAAGAVLARPPLLGPRLRAAAMLGALLLTPVLLAIDIWHTTPMQHLRHHPPLAIGAVVLGVAVVGALAWVFHRWREAFPLAAVFTLPFRLPISSAGSTANLLVPLYLVVAGAALAHLLPRLLRGAEETGPPGQPDQGCAAGGGGAAGESDADGALSGDAEAGSLPRRLLVSLSSRAALEWLLIASVLLYAIQAAYSPGFSKALQNLVFFYVPFALLFRLLLEVRWTGRLLRRCVGVSIGLAIVFAGVGFVEYQRKALFLNPKIVAANVYDNYFRVNSVFFDPNIYGRFLVLVMLLLAAAVLFSAKRRRDALLGALMLAWLWAGLITSFSQSSIVALLVGLAVLAAWRWRARYTILAAAAVLAAGVVFLIAAPSSLHFGVKGSGGSLNNATSGRAKLVSGGLKLFSERPLAGYGSGSFSDEYRDHQVASVASATSASHTIPITVAAEQGVIGLLLYGALLIACFANLWPGTIGRGAWARFAPGAGRAPPGGPRSAARIAILACFAALVLHTMAYADFLEDPVTWTLLAVGVALAAAPRRESSATGEPPTTAAAPVAATVRPAAAD
ncbi:MAG TPA: O-antigen ligase family protein [Solirubrobacteraceae bacterium]|jgi:O-antigen ligase